MMRLRATTLAVTLLLPVPALAADFEPPKGCETFLTVQARQCSVLNLYRCDVANDGTFWEAMHSDMGLESVVTYAASYQWLDALYFWDNSREEYMPPAEDPIDLEALESDGVDTFRFTMRRTAPSEDREITAVGADILTGETIVIDGITLDIVQTELQILSADGTVEYHSRGFQYLDRDSGLFFLGPETVYDEAGEGIEYDGSPIDFIHPGEPGFAATRPLYECDQQKAGFTPAPAVPAPGQKEMNHDQI